MTTRHRICWQWKDGGSIAYRGPWFGGTREDAEAVVAEQNRLDDEVEYWLEVKERVNGNEE